VGPYRLPSFDLVRAVLQHIPMWCSMLIKYNDPKMVRLFQGLCAGRGRRLTSLSTNAGLPDCVTSILTDDSLTEFNCATASGHLDFAENPQSSSVSQRPTSGAANPLYNPSSLSANTPTTGTESTTTTTTLVVVSTSPSTTVKAAGSSAQRVSSAFAGPATLTVVVFTAAFVFFLVV
jgi:hypothetical protein